MRQYGQSFVDAESLQAGAPLEQILLGSMPEFSLGARDERSSTPQPNKVERSASGSSISCRSESPLPFTRCTTDRFLTELRAANSNRLGPATLSVSSATLDANFVGGCASSRHGEQADTSVVCLDDVFLGHAARKSPRSSETYAAGLYARRHKKADYFTLSPPASPPAHTEDADGEGEARLVPIQRTRSLRLNRMSLSALQQRRKAKFSSDDASAPGEDDNGSQHYESQDFRAYGEHRHCEVCCAIQ